MLKLIGGLFIVGVIIAIVAGSASTPTPSTTSAQAETSHHGKRADKRAQAAKPELTSAQENAIESAKSYLDMSGFSKRGLIGQLSSKAADGYSRADATFAVNHLDVDWNAEAVESARSYLDASSFSKNGLIEQLSSSAGDGFTRAQAQYAADKVY